MPLSDSHTLYRGAMERDVRMGHPVVTLSHDTNKAQPKPLEGSHSYPDPEPNRIALWRVPHPMQGELVTLFPACPAGTGDLRGCARSPTLTRASLRRTPPPPGPHRRHLGSSMPVSQLVLSPTSYSQ